MGLSLPSVYECSADCLLPLSQMDPRPDNASGTTLLQVPTLQKLLHTTSGSGVSSTPSGTSCLCRFLHHRCNAIIWTVLGGHVLSLSALLSRSFLDTITTWGNTKPLDEARRIKRCFEEILRSYFVQCMSHHSLHLTPILPEGSDHACI